MTLQPELDDYLAKARLVDAERRIQKRVVFGHDMSQFAAMPFMIEPQD